MPFAFETPAGHDQPVSDDVVISLKYPLIPSVELGPMDDVTAQ